jgi:hypothetical protein
MATRKVIDCDACGKPGIHEAGSLLIRCGHIMETPYDATEAAHPLDLCADCAQVALARVAHRLPKEAGRDLLVWAKERIKTHPNDRRP